MLALPQSGLLQIRIGKIFTGNAVYEQIEPAMIPNRAPERGFHFLL